MSDERDEEMTNEQTIEVKADGTLEITVKGQITDLTRLIERKIQHEATMEALDKFMKSAKEAGNDVFKIVEIFVENAYANLICEGLLQEKQDVKGYADAKMRQAVKDAEQGFEAMKKQAAEAIRQAKEDNDDDDA